MTQGFTGGVELSNVVGPASATDNALARYNGATGKILQDSTVLVSDAGQMTNPSQPCFAAAMSGTASNVTGDGTVYNIAFDTENYDQNDNFSMSTGLFTTPVNGKYYFKTTVRFNGILAGHNIGQIEFYVSGGSYLANYGNYAAMSTGGTLILEASSMIIATTAAVAVGVRVTVSGSTKVVDIGSGSTEFEGFLIC